MGCHRSFSGADAGLAVVNEGLPYFREGNGAAGVQVPTARTLVFLLMRMGKNE